MAMPITEPTSSAQNGPVDGYASPVTASTISKSIAATTKYITTRKAIAAMNVTLRSAEAGLERSNTRMSPTARREARSPTAMVMIGSATASRRFAAYRVLVAAMAMVAMTEPTYDSKMSAPMPAVSPTQSPTLSAMVAGLRGSSSGMPASTLPTRSAPTSAALV